MIYNITQTNWGQLFPRAKQYAIEHSPQILTGIGLSAIIGAGVIAVKNTPAAYAEIEGRKRDAGVDKLPLFDVIKYGLRYYIVPAGLAIAGATCIIGGIKISTDRANAFAALAASEAMRLRNYREAANEKLGAKKAGDIDTEVAQKEIEQSGIPNINVIEESGHGEQIVFWPTMGRWFKCDIGWIRRIENEVNREISAGDVNEHDPYDTKSLTGVSLNRFLAGLGIAKCDIGMLLGWNGENKLHIVFRDILTDKESEKAVVLTMHMDDCMPMPKWDTVRQNCPQYLAPF